MIWLLTMICGGPNISVVIFSSMFTFCIYSFIHLHTVVPVLMIWAGIIPGRVRFCVTHLYPLFFTHFRQQDYLYSYITVYWAHKNISDLLHSAFTLSYNIHAMGHPANIKLLFYVMWNM